jgi:L-arabinokinase
MTQCIARAPGRLDVMGGIADYSGSLVLQLPLAVHTTATLTPRDDRVVEVSSKRGAGRDVFRVELDELLSGALSTPDGLRAHFADGRLPRWGAYVLGAAYACLVRNGARLSTSPTGFQLHIDSQVPSGKGVSSSAALEVATFGAIAAAHDGRFTSEEIATECQWAENHIAGAPCGIMDQMTSACGESDHLLRLRCQPAIIEGQVAIPAGWRFYGVDSGIRHAVSGADYGTVRTAAFMGYRIIAALAGLAVTPDGDRVRVHDDAWHGYLANITPAEFASRFERQLPDEMRGAEFLAEYGGITDVVTRVAPERAYPVRVATAHPVHENARVERFAELLASLADDAGAAIEMGALMYASHASYSACGLGSDGTDRLVEMVRAVGADGGMFGAKITGGGSGGTVAILARSSAEDAVRDLARRYSRETGRAAEVFAASGPGLSTLSS